MAERFDQRLECSIQNTDFLWCRARFDKDMVQYNQVNKIQVEIFSKLTHSLRVESVELVMTESK